MLLVDSIPVLRAKGFVSLKYLCVPSLGQIWQKQCGGFAAFVVFFYSSVFFPRTCGAEGKVPEQIHIHLGCDSQHWGISRGLERRRS